jgi:hypothetical protein
MRADNARGRNFFRRVAAKRTMSAALQPKAVRQTICLANFINWGIDMKKTDNYSLPQWEKRDFIKMEDFNDAFGKTDAALKAHDTALGEKAAATALAAEAENRSAALAALQTALSAAIGSGGKTCRIFTGSYTGTGSTSVSIPTPFYPVLAFVQSAGMATALCLFRSADTVQNNKDFGVGDGKSLTVTWGARQLSWVCSSGGTMSSTYAGNSKNVEYHYVIVGFDNAGA